MVANKECVECAGLCRSLTVFIKGKPVKVDYYVLPVAACPLVLGVQWLATLGTIETDYSTLTMNFKQDGQIHTFHGLRLQGIEVLTTKDLCGVQGLGKYGTAFSCNISHWQLKIILN